MRLNKKRVMTLADSIKNRPRLTVEATAGLDRGQVLTRYLPHWKFTDLVGSCSLFFPRLQLLVDQDPDEGRIATSAYLDHVHMINPPAGVRADQNAYLEFLKLGPHHQAYVSCWYMGEANSDRMWGEYVRDGEGVAISTTVGQLLDCFDGDDGIKVVSLAPIEYVKVDADMPELQNRENRVAALRYKGDGWKHENEIRAIVLYDMYYVSPQLPILGERMAVVVDAFLNRITIAPNATKNYIQNVQRLLANTPLAKLVSGP
jgi:hypothetical protein